MHSSFFLLLPLLAITFAITTFSPLTALDVNEALKAVARDLSSSSEHKRQQQDALDVEARARNVLKPDFSQRVARTRFEEKAFFVEDIRTTCPSSRANVGAYIRWTNEAGSGSFATPLIYDLLADGRKEIITPTFTHYIEALDGETGRDVYDWPFTHPRLKTQASPVVVDIEPDGISEIMVSTYYGELLFFTEEGQLRKGKTIRLPRIIVDRNWSRDFRNEDRIGVEARKAEMNWKNQLVKGQQQDVTSKANEGLRPGEAKKLSSIISIKQDVAVRGNQVQAQEKEKLVLQKEAEKAAAASAKSSSPSDGAHRTLPPSRPTAGGFKLGGAAGGFIKKHKSSKDDALILDDSVVKVSLPSQTTAEPPAPRGDDGRTKNRKDPDTTMAPTAIPATTAVVVVAPNSPSPAASVSPAPHHHEEQQQQQQQQQQQSPSPSPAVPQQQHQTDEHHLHQHHHHHDDNNNNENNNINKQQHHHHHHQEKKHSDEQSGQRDEVSDRALLFDDDALPPVQHVNADGTLQDPEFEDFKPPENWDYDAHDLEHDPSSAIDWPDDAHNNVKLQGAGAPLSPEAKASMNLAFHSELFEAYDSGERAKSSSGGVGKTTGASGEAARMYVDPRESVRHEADPKQFNGKNFDPNVHVYLQPHILATPVVTDLDLDGKFDVIIPVSYFLDTGHPGEGNDDEIDTDLYVVSEIVCLDLASGSVKWRNRLRTTTKHSTYPAYILSSPVVVDVDSNILLDVVVTTSDGMLNVFDYRGQHLPGWPVQMAPIHGPALVDDVNSDGKIEVCAGDATGTIACFTNRGQYLWDRHLTGEIADGMSAGDVNGDGILDIVVGTSSGQLWAVDGRRGQLLPGFPVQISSSDVRDDTAIVAPPLLINLNDTRPPLDAERSAGLHIVFPATDGRLYIVSGTTGCIEMIDLGHASYTQVLADDLIGNGKIALVVTTLSGAIHVIETKAAYSPMKAWPSRPVGLNGYTARESRLGIVVQDQFRHAHDVQGDHWTLAFDIIDRRFENVPNVPVNSQHPLYFVVITYGKRLIAFGGAYRQPGTYKVDIPAPPERLHTMVHVMMRVTGGQFVEDSFAMSFNAHVLDTAKYILVLPFLAIMAALCFVKKSHEISQVEGMHAAGATLVRRGPNGELVRVSGSPHDPWGIFMDEYELEEYLLALERERMVRALRGKGVLAGRNGHHQTQAQAQAAARMRTQQHQRNQQQLNQQAVPPSANQQQQSRTTTTSTTTSSMRNSANVAPSAVAAGYADGDDDV